MTGIPLPILAALAAAGYLMTRSAGAAEPAASSGSSSSGRPPGPIDLDSPIIGSDGYPQDYDFLFEREGHAAGVPPLWLKATSGVESDFGRDSLVRAGQVSRDGLSYGLMQLRESTARDFDPAVTIAKLNDPAYSIRVAAKFMAWVRSQWDLNDPRFEEWCIRSYNGGVGGTQEVRRYLAGGTIDLTRLEATMKREQETAIYYGRWRKIYERLR